MSQAFAQGFMEVRLTGPHADLIWRAMQLADCAPDAALEYLLALAGGQLDSGDWDGSTASQKAVQDVQVKATNLESFMQFSVGQVVWVSAPHTGKSAVVGTIRELGSCWAQLELSRGTQARHGMVMGDGLYPVRIADLQEL